MMITFYELGLDPCPASHTRAYVINDACDYIMRHYFPKAREEDVIFEPHNALVDYTWKTVVIRTANPMMH